MTINISLDSLPDTLQNVYFGRSEDAVFARFEGVGVLARVHDQDDEDRGALESEQTHKDPVVQEALDSARILHRFAERILAYWIFHPGKFWSQ